MIKILIISFVLIEHVACNSCPTCCLFITPCLSCLPPLVHLERASGLQDFLPAFHFQEGVWREQLPEWIVCQRSSWRTQQHARLVEHREAVSSEQRDQPGSDIWKCFFYSFSQGLWILSTSKSKQRGYLVEGKCCGKKDMRLVSVMDLIFRACCMLGTDHGFNMIKISKLSWSVHTVRRTRRWTWMITVAEPSCGSYCTSPCTTTLR